MLLRRFWLTGTGTGAFQMAMVVYQRSSPGKLFNQAHNHYLQAAAEGGLLLCIPIAAAMAALVRGCTRALSADRSGMVWIRIGAISGLIGVAVQSLLETGLTTPANGVLAAILAAVATHAPAEPTAPRT